MRCPDAHTWMKHSSAPWHAAFPGYGTVTVSSLVTFTVYILFGPVEDLSAFCDRVWYIQQTPAWCSIRRSGGADWREMNTNPCLVFIRKPIILYTVVVTRSWWAWWIVKLQLSFPMARTATDDKDSEALLQYSLAAC